MTQQNGFCTYLLAFPSQESQYHSENIKKVDSDYFQLFIAVYDIFVELCKHRCVTQRCKIHALQRQNTEISKQLFPEKEFRGLSPNFHIHAAVSDL